MATTRIMPLHAGKGRTVGKAISDIIDYVKNPDKTDHGRLITSYQCDSRVADAQFLLDKQTYAARTGRVRGKDDVIAYHLRPTSGWATRRSPPTRSNCARPLTGHWYRNRAPWRSFFVCWNRTASPSTGAAKPFPSARRAGATISALTDWTATRWTICLPSSPGKRSIHPERKLLCRLLRPRSICW